MFGMTYREQRLKAEQKAAEVFAPMVIAAMHSIAEVEVAKSQVDASELTRLRAENIELRRLLTRYRIETPPGHQPHMIAHDVDKAIDAQC